MQLSIIIATFNVQAFIKKCLLSCYEENYKDSYEIIIVDDGSADKTIDIIKDIQEIIPNLKLITKKNSGLGASRNTGIENAKGKYIWMIDGDDFLEPNIINVFFSHFNDNADIYALNYNITDENGSPLYKAYPDNYIMEVMTGTEYYIINYEKNYTWQYIFKKNLFIDNNIIFKERINMQDSEILPKLLFHTSSLKYLNKVGYNYVQYQNSYTNTENPEKRFRYFESIITVRDSLKAFAESIEYKNPKLYEGIQRKIDSLSGIVLNHLTFFRYTNSEFLKNIALLQKAGLYPINAKTKGKMKLIKNTINNFPKIANLILNIFK